MSAVQKSLLTAIVSAILLLNIIALEKYYFDTGETIRRNNIQRIEAAELGDLGASESILLDYDFPRQAIAFGLRDYRDATWGEKLSAALSSIMGNSTSHELKVYYTYNSYSLASSRSRLENIDWAIENRLAVLAESPKAGDAWRLYKTVPVDLSDHDPQLGSALSQNNESDIPKQTKSPFLMADAYYPDPAADVVVKNAKQKQHIEDMIKEERYVVISPIRHLFGTPFEGVVVATEH